MARKPEIGSEEVVEGEVPEIKAKEDSDDKQIVIPRVVSNEEMLNAIYDNTQRILNFVIPKEE